MNKVVTKAHLVSMVAEKSGMPRTKTEKAINSMIQNIKDALGSGKDVSLVGFGSFTTTTRSARKGRNPQTGEPIDIPPKTVAKFRPGKNLKEAVDEKR